jgi:hypothetical protein
MASTYPAEFLGWAANWAASRRAIAPTWSWLDRSAGAGQLDRGQA